MVDRFAADWHTADLDARTMALLEYAEKLTMSPNACNQDNIETLRAVGWSDRAITDAVQVCAYFNYINRIAEGLGVDDEKWLGPDGKPV